MIKTYCDICGSEKYVQETKNFLERLKERLGEFGFYQTIEWSFREFGEKSKCINHICEDCREKIAKGIYNHYQSLFNSFFKED